MIYDNKELNASEVTVLDYKRDNGIVAWMDRGGSNVSNLDIQMHGAIKLIATADPKHKENRFSIRASELRVPTAVFDIPRYEKERGVRPGDYARTERDPLNILDGSRSYVEVREIRKDGSEAFLSAIRDAQKRIGMPEDTPIFGLGGMQLLYADTINAALFLNVHPGDLTLTGEKKKRVLTGDAWRPSAEALRRGYRALCSTTFRMVPHMDEGPLFMRGYSLVVDYNRLRTFADLKNEHERRAVAEAAQEALKFIGDHVIVGATLEGLFNGLWGVHEPTGTLAYEFDGRWHEAPIGVTTIEHVLNMGTSPFKRSTDFIRDKTELFYARAKRNVEETRVEAEKKL